MSEGFRPAKRPPAIRLFLPGVSPGVPGVPELSAGHFTAAFCRSFPPEVLPAVFLWAVPCPPISGLPFSLLPLRAFRVRTPVHMSFYVYLLLGFLGGIPAGMGMGGGTVTIPLLVLVGGVEQKIAQSANLFSFFPMSAGALRVHAQNGLLETKGILWIILPALLFSAAGALLAYVLPSAMLRRAFGVFLVILSFFQFRGAFSGEN